MLDGFRFDSVFVSLFGSMIIGMAFGVIYNFAVVFMVYIAFALVISDRPECLFRIFLTLYTYVDF